MPGLYATHVFPRLMDWDMGTKRFQEQRKRALAPLYGAVLEIGFGTGLNLPHYPKKVTGVTAVEPEQALPNKVTRRSVMASMPVEIIRVNAETLPFEEGRFDCVLSTWTLCTIPDVLAALKEVRRVSKPDGIFVFLEHGRSDDPRIAKWQHLLNPVQRLLACGCNLNRPIDAHIEEAGFTISHLERFRMEGIPRIAAAMYSGIASPAKT